MFHCRILFIFIVCLAFLCGPANIFAASQKPVEATKQVPRAKSRAAHSPKVKKRAKASKPKKTREAENTAVGVEQMGIFTAYTGKAKKKNRSRKTADGTSLKEDDSCVLANNSLAPGTRVFIDSIGTCEVHDRIGKRTSANHFDVHLTDSRKWSKNFGKQKLKYRIISKPEKA